MPTSTLIPYRIAVAGVPLPPLTYLAPKSLVVGTRVLVPVGHRTCVGMMLGEDAHPSTEYELKPIIQTLDPLPIWHTTELSLLDWCSRYYHAPWGMVLETALPPTLHSVKQPKQPRKPIATPTQTTPDLMTLNEEQTQAYQAIASHLTGFTPWVLEGVTGSGKTEVYAQLIAQVLAQNKQVLLLVPEIGLTPQMVERLSSRVGIHAVVLHSELPPVQRERTWRMTQQGAPVLVIGTRSAVFAPLPKLGLLLIDEEHDTSYKQQDGIRYHARDVGIMRAKLQSCPVVLGSATPSLETLANVQNGKYRHLRLTQRANTQPLPTLHTIDMRHQAWEGGLSTALLHAVQQALAQDEQVLLFLNRRGYAPILMCHSCGNTLDCPACDVPYTFHRHNPNLRCHHCGLTKYTTPTHCPHCGEQAWHLMGQGTQKLEEVLAGHFPNIPILRIDRDSSQGKDVLSTRLEQIRTGEAKLILGTQMLAKGHDFAGIQLVGIVDVDGALFARDFRALEHLAQQVTQVSGRSGRGDKAGRVLLQTHQPNHPFIQQLLSQPYHQIARSLLEERKAAHLPPFVFSAWIMAESKRQEAVIEQLSRLAQHPRDARVHISDIMPALMHKRQYYYRSLIWIESEDRKALHATLDELMTRLSLPKQRVSGVRVFLDVDPQDMP